MKQRAKLLANSTLFRYIVIGGLSYIIEIATIIGLQHANFTPTQSVAFSFWVGLIVSFLLQRVLAFQDRRTDKRVLISQMLLYGVLVVFNYIFTLGAVYILSFQMDTVVARTIALFITTSWNYIIYRKIFHNPQ